MSLATKAVLAELHISQWYNRVTDQRAKAEYAEAHGIDNRDDQYIKRPLPKSAFKRVESAINRIRNYHNAVTLPWGAAGMRLLPSKDIFRYVQHMNELKGALETEVSELADRMEDWKNVAKETRKDTYDPDDYPESDAFRNAFVITTGFFDLPVGDFRVEVASEEADEVRKALEENFNKSLAHLHDEFRGRLVQRLEHLAASQTAKLFRSESHTNTGELIQLIRDMGFAEAPSLKKAVARTQELLDAFSPVVLRNDPDARLLLHDNVNRLLDELKSTTKSEESSETTLPSSDSTVDSPV
jgi:hypothetical protein